jgi:membrane protein implicated in regulation of membrane protease activity
VSTGFKNRNLTMNAVTVAFLVVGGIGIAVLAASLLVGDLLHLGHPDADGAFSLPSVAAFVGAFGFGGALVASVVGSGVVALVAGVVAGIVVAFPAALGTAAMARAVSRMRTDATPTRTDLIGRLGVVVTPITEGGYGEVRVAIGGQPVKLNARADRPVPLGAQVFVIAAPSDTSVVVEQTTPVTPKEEK